MKKYDFKSIKKYIQTHSDYIDSVDIGLKEDWFWTTDTIYENNHFIHEIDKNEFSVCGMVGSAWATPTMNVHFKDGKEIWKDCYIGKSESQKPEWFSLGVLSGPVQDTVNLLSTPRIESK